MCPKYRPINQIFKLITRLMEKVFIFLLFKHLMANNGLKSANESYTHLNCFPHLSAGLSLSLNIKKSNPPPNTAPAWPADSPLHPLVYI